MPDLTIADFTSWVGQPCEIIAPEGRAQMTLAAAEPLTGSPREGGGFRLEFHGPGEPALEQSVVEVAGPAGRYDIFIVPIGRGPEGLRYEAIFF